MGAFSETHMAELLAPYVSGEVPQDIYAQLGRYLDLLLLWNGRTNLTAIREPEGIVQRQIGESLFASRLIPASGSLLDFGSGAGFPGIPLKVLRPDLDVTLAESQGKKASFLREASRVLGLRVTVWAKRVEDLPATAAFDVVTMRAVDRTREMLAVATGRVSAEGRLVRFLAGSEDAEMDDWQLKEKLVVPQSVGTVASFARR